MTKKSLLAAALIVAACPIIASAQTLGFWEFNDPGLVITDSSGNNLHGTVGFLVDTDSDPITVTDTPSGAEGDRALQIRGGPVVVDDSEERLLNLIGEAFTVEYWIKIDEPLEGRSWMGTVYYGRHGTGWGTGFQNQNVKFTLFGVVDIFPGIALSPDGEWHHLAFSFEPGVGVTSYLDGEFFAFNAETRPMNPTDANVLWLGTEDGASRPYPGKMDRFRVTRGALDENGIDSDSAEPKPVTDNVVVYFPFDEEEGPTFSDAASDLTALVGSQWSALGQAPDFVEDTPSGTGYSLNFGLGDHVVVRDPDEMLNFQYQDFTLEMWVKPGAFPDASALLLRYGGDELAPADSGGYGLSVNRETGTISLTFYQVMDGSDHTVTTPAGSLPIDGEWHHIAVAYSEDDFWLYFYVNGELAHEEDHFAGIITAKDVYVLHFGGSWDGRSPYVGGMDRDRKSVV